MRRDPILFGVQCSAQKLQERIVGGSRLGFKDTTIQLWCQVKKFSVSEANDFKSCPRLYYYKHIKGWEPINKAAWLTKGSAYDKLLENWDVLGFEGALKSIPELFPNGYEAVDAEYILRIYNEKFQSNPLHPVTFDNRAGNQLGFGVEFRGNEVTGPVEVRVTGYLDKLSSTEGELEVVERKTTSDEIEEKRKAKDSGSIEDQSPFWDKWSMDPQTKNYVWYLRSLGGKAGWVTVEAIRKPSGTVNKVFKKDCPVEEYRARVMAHAEKKTLVARHRFYVSEDASDEFIVDHVNTLHMINGCKARQAEIEGRGYEGQYAWTKNQDSCGNYGGCVHKDVCLGNTTHEACGQFTKSEKWLKNQEGA